jgi:hypothetical protein
MLIMFVGHEDSKVAVWHWGPDNVQHYTEPAVLATNPQEVVMAMGGLLLWHRKQWQSEGWTRVWVEDAFRSRLIWGTDLDQLPVNDSDLFPWVMGKVKAYAAQYQA